MKTGKIKEEVIKISSNLGLITALFTEIEDVERYDYA